MFLKAYISKNKDINVVEYLIITWEYEENFLKYFLINEGA